MNEEVLDNGYIFQNKNGIKYYNDDFSVEKEQEKSCEYNMYM